jgi:hypothetical protein
LEFYIADLLKAGEVNKEKLKKTSQICGEWVVFDPASSYLCLIVELNQL